MKTAETRGYGVDSAASWLVAAAGFIIQCMAVGSNRANGLLFVAFVEYNQCSREEASWPFTMPGVGVIFFAPLTGYLTSKFAVRTVAIFGVLLMFVGSSACFFSTNVYYVSAFFGVVRGAGYSMCLNSVPGTINESFLRHRATAMGIAMAGDSVGSFLFPLILQHFLDVYLLRGAFLLLGALSLHGAFGAAILVPPSQRRKPKHAEKRNLQGTVPRGDQNDHLPSEALNLRKNGRWESAEMINRESFPTSEAGHEKEGNEEEMSFLFGLSKSKENGENVHQDELTDVHASETEKLNEKTQSVVIVTRNDKLKAENTVPAELNFVAEDPKVKDCAFSYKRSLKNIFMCRGFYLNAFTQVVDTFFISNFNLVIVDYVADKGVPFDQGLFMLTVFAIGQLVGRMGLGWITDKQYMSRPMFLVMFMVVNAGLSLLLTWVYSYVGLMFCGLALGMVGGTILPVCSVLFMDYLKTEDINLAVSLAICIKGAFYMTRIPMIGYFRDQLGTYDYLFHVLAGMSFLSALTWFCEGIFNRRRKPATNYKS